MPIIDLESLMEEAQDMFEEQLCINFDPPLPDVDLDDPDDPDFVVLSQRLDKEDLLDDRIPF